MNDVAVVYVGVDVSKDSLRFDAGDFFTGDVKNKPAAIRSALKRLAGKLPAGSVPHVCYESTGRYGWDLAAACAAAGIPSSILNPCKVRQYTQAMSVSAKTDPVDAWMIRLFAEHRKPPADEPVTAAQALAANSRPCSRARLRFCPSIASIRPFSNRCRTTLPLGKSG